MPTFVHYLWILLTLLVSVTCTYSLLQPEWFIHPDFIHSFGVYSYCLRDFRYTFPRQICGYYGGQFGFSNVPSKAWKAASLLYGGGSMFLCISCLFTLISLCIRRGCDTIVILMTSYLQTAAVVFLICGIISFPFGLSSDYFRHYCGESASIFHSDICSVGWAYMLAIVGTALSVFCPILSHFVDTSKDERTAIKTDV
ncbi:hypothetical protein CHS0354_019937 [Potamilus streckersoni]|uniref:Uncharacterized protein n=1 Tax=Potamilus streckersoni TaxID=2493646 RepID=A0AAE0S0F3_9BIVA|nr:hypothetical protein CHS0354_019937 [Potamilus streckersoni]